MVTFFEEVVDFEATQVANGLDEISFQVVGGFVGVAVGAAEGFGDDRVDDFEFGQVGRGEFQGGSGCGGFGAVAPEDGGAGFGGSDGVPGVLEHGGVVAEANTEGAAGAAFTDDGADNRDA